MKRVFLYVRVSTEEQALHGLSIEAQTAVLTEWAQKNKHKIIGVYTDAGISARKPATKRPELQRLLNDVQSGKGDMIVFTKLDRWFRSLQEYYKVQEILEKCNVAWKTIHEDYDTSTASGRLKVNIMLSVAQDEADRTSERIKAINELKRKKKEPLTGDCPFGYKQEQKKYIKDPEKEEAVRSFFSRYLESGSVAEAQKAAMEHGERISYQKAHKMLDASCYYGRYFDTDGMTPPYITIEEHEKIQSMRRRIVRKTAHNRVYIFSGLITCGECGKRMGGRVNTNQASFFYNCTSHYMRASGCTNNKNMLEWKLEKYLIDTIDDKMRQVKIAAGSVGPVIDARNYKAEIAALKAKCERLKNLYIDGLISREECNQKCDECVEKIEEIEKCMKSYRKPDFSKIDSILKSDWKVVYNGLGKEEKRDFWRIIIKEIRIYQDRHIEYDFAV